MPCYCPSYTEFSYSNNRFCHLADVLDKTGGKLATVEDIETIWDIPDKPTEPVQGGDDANYAEAMTDYTNDLAVYKKKVGLLQWYATDFLPMSAGVETWGPVQKCTKLLTDKVMLEDNNSGKAKVLVPVTSEAFGQVMFKNCRKKCLAIWNWRKTHGAKKAVPKCAKDDPSTHVWNGLWSNTKGSEGRVEGTTWHQDGLEYLNERIEAISAIRAKEADNGYDRMKLARTYIQEAMGVEPETRGRTRTAAEVNNAAVEGAVLQKRVKLTVLDE